MFGTRHVAAGVAILSALWCAPGAHAQSNSPEIYFVQDAAAQFNQLALRPEPFGFRSPDDFSPTFLDYHYQGIVRRHGTGTPYLFVSRNRDGAGYLLVVKMGSRDRTGERLRSNRLFRDSPIGGVPNFLTTLPDPRDTTVAVVRFNGNNGWPAYKHPGGMQMVGNILAVPLSQPGDGYPANRVAFINVSNPESPYIASHFDPDARGSSEFGVGQVALTPVRNIAGPGVRYIMLLAGESNKDVRLYESLPTNTEEGSTDLAHPDLKWKEIDSWTGDELDDPGVNTWPCCESKSHQNFTFVRQQNLDGPLFLIAAFNPEPAIAPGGGEDFLDLYRVHVDEYGRPGTRLLSHIERKHVTTNSIGGDTAHFAGSTGVYVSPSGELIVYSTEHTNQGPVDENGRHTVRGGEWRHREMVRPDNPTLRPTVDAPVFTVDEGGSRTLVGRGRPPLTRAWLQLFIDDGLGLSDSHFNTEVAIDYDDRNKDDFDDLFRLLWYFNDEASSWRWFAPQGCTIQASQHNVRDDDFPGRYKTLVGEGMVTAATNLDEVQSDNAPGSMNDMISAVGFSCGTYYTTPVTVSWDLDRNDSFETFGETALFSAAALDGPSTVGIPVRAQHLTDSTALGVSSPHAVEVRVTNVAPTVTESAIKDPLGRVMGVDAPFGITGVEYSVAASFTDPGRPDTQTATIAWGDGSVDQSASFRTFSDAFGGAIGKVDHGHRFQAPGSFTVILKVTDDELDFGTFEMPLDIVSPAVALEYVVGEIDTLIAGTANASLRRHLEFARRLLSGNAQGSSSNGALEKLAGGETEAAIAKVNEAIEELKRAQAEGASVSPLIALLEQIVLALSAA
jgi:hypothetical protein